MAKISKNLKNVKNISVIDAKKGLRMFEKVSVPVLGIIENMSYFICDECGKKHYLFQKGGGSRISDSLGVPFCGEIPLDSEVSRCGDEGMPIVIKNPNSEITNAYMAISKTIARQIERRA